MTRPSGQSPLRDPAKAALRTIVKSAIAAIQPDDRKEQEAILLRRFPDLPGIAEAVSVLLFVSAFPEEPRTFDLFTLVRAMQKKIICPRINQPHEIADPATDLCAGPLGIPEPRPDTPEVAPEEVDWALVPGLAFDEQGFRLGRGGGYYDRLLVRLRPETVCWALGFESQLVERVPTEPHDLPLSGVTTPTRTIRGRRFSQSF
jgi:5-formyltetrahydrofolate cyclo-ligase